VKDLRFFEVELSVKESSMTIPPQRQTVEALGLEDKDLVQLYLELIRIIEKDIDELKAGAARSGWTSWAIIGGVVGALLLLFGETRKLQSFPVEEVKLLGLAGLLLYNIAILSINAFSIPLPEIRPGRVRWSNEAFFSYQPKVIYRFLIFLFGTFLAFSLTAPNSVRVITGITFLLWTLGTVVALIYAKIKYPLGNTKLTRKGAYITYVAVLPGTLIVLALLAVQIPFPVGETATLPYVLAGLILAIVVLVENLISLMAPSRLLSNLQELRNDILFLRVDIDEALRRYELLTEGETLPDALQKDLSEIAKDLNLVTYAHSNMNALLGKMYRQLPLPEEQAEKKEQKQLQRQLFHDSYALHEAKCREITEPLKSKLKKFNRKSLRVRVATDDQEGESNIRLMLSRRLQFLEQNEIQLKRSMENLNHYAANPEKIPEELRKYITEPPDKTE
jgi:hypothetical protein